MTLTVTWYLWQEVRLSVSPMLSDTLNVMAMSNEYPAHSLTNNIALAQTQNINIIHKIHKHYVQQNIVYIEPYILSFIWLLLYNIYRTTYALQPTTESICVMLYSS